MKTVAWCRMSRLRNNDDGFCNAARHPFADRSVVGGRSSRRADCRLDARHGVFYQRSLRTLWVVNQSLLERYGLSDKAQMIGKRYCDVCPDDFGRIPTEQNAQVIKRIHGISPMQLIAKTRITAGCRMLHESALRLRRSHWNAPSPITAPLPGSFARSQACRPLSIGG